MDRQDDVWPHNGTRVQHNDLTIYHRPKGIRHWADDILSRSILAMIRENGSIKPIVYVVASASAVAAATPSLRRRAH
jgi:hypothetical protein